MGSGTSGKLTNTTRLKKIRTKKSSLMHKLMAFKQVPCKVISDAACCCAPCVKVICIHWCVLLPLHVVAAGSSCINEHGICVCHVFNIMSEARPVPI